MAAVVFMRGVNVGGHKSFRPAVFARELAALDVVNIGAAGTFVVRNMVSQAVLRAEFLRRLPFEAEFMICTERTFVALMSKDPFPRHQPVEGARRYVSVLAKRPSTLPRLPLSHPSGSAWQVRLTGVSGRFALSLWRRAGKRLLYPNEIVERELAVSATTRNWDTMAKVHRVLRGG